MSFVINLFLICHLLINLFTYLFIYLFIYLFMIYFFIIFQPSSESSSGRDNVITNNSGGGEGSHMILEESDHMAVVSVHAFLQVRYITSIFQGIFSFWCHL